jgi:hypothetical protein
MQNKKRKNKSHHYVKKMLNANTHAYLGINYKWFPIVMLSKHIHAHQIYQPDLSNTYLWRYKKKRMMLGIEITLTSIL